MRRALAASVLLTAVGLLVPTLPLGAVGNGAYRRVAPGTVLFNEPGKGTASGALIDLDKKLVVTAEHVIRPYVRAGQSRVNVLFAQSTLDGKIITDAVYYSKRTSTLSVPGTIVYVDRSKDLALVKLDRLPAGAVALKLAREAPEPGERIHVVGNSTFSKGGAFGYSTGTVRNTHFYSAFDRMFVFYSLTHHAPTNRGDSGGPVVNDWGELVGIVSQGTGGGSSDQVVDYSIHLNEIRRALAGAQHPSGTTITMSLAVDSVGTDRFLVPIVKGEKLHASVAGKGTTDLDLYLEDLDHVEGKKVGRTLVGKTGLTDREEAEAKLDFGGTCLVKVPNLHLRKVKNGGPTTALNQYTLTINRGASVRGPFTAIRRIAAGGIDSYKLRYEAGAGKGRVTLRGDGDTDLDLFVDGPDGKEMEKSVGLTDREEVNFLPKQTATYTIRVKNLGKVWNEYVLTTD
jgi:hypothetical protein